MKSSGVPWLGDVPEPWDVVRLRFVCQINPPKSEVPSLPEDFISNFVLATPPLEEQEIIFGFLDSKTAEIDEVIRLKEEHIELLNNKRQALINRSVTCGLDPSVKLCPSGIEWLGDIPEHWQ